MSVRSRKTPTAALRRHRRRGRGGRTRRHRRKRRGGRRRRHRRKRRGASGAADEGAVTGASAEAQAPRRANEAGRPLTCGADFLSNQRRRACGADLLSVLLPQVIQGQHVHQPLLSRHQRSDLGHTKWGSMSQAEAQHDLEPLHLDAENNIIKSLRSFTRNAWPRKPVSMNKEQD